MYRIIMKENFMQQIFLKIYILGQQLKKEIWLTISLALYYY